MELIYRNEYDASRSNKRDFTPTEILKVPSNDAHQDIPASDDLALVDRPVVEKISSAEEKLPSISDIKTWTSSEIKAVSSTEGGKHKSQSVVESLPPSLSNAAAETPAREVSSFSIALLAKLTDNLIDNFLQPNAPPSFL
jgi:hypothetical protein